MQMPFLSRYFALVLALLGAACPRDQRDHHASTSVASSSGPKHSPAIQADLGCGELPADHDELYKRGTSLIEPFLKLSDRAAASGSDREARLSAGIACLDRVVDLNAANWPAFWLRGKAHQALGDHVRACMSFESAYSIESNNPDVGRELAVEYLGIGRSADAVRIAQSVSQAHPHDAGLRANLALALIMNRQIARAHEEIAEARRRDPADPISQAVERRIIQIMSGARPQPTTLTELERE